MYKRFQELLQKNDTNAYRVSKETGINISTLSHWKTGKIKYPQIKTLKIIADYFGVDIEYFIE